MAGGWHQRKRGRKRKPLCPAELSDFCSQTAAMAGTGIPFSKAVSILTGSPGRRKLAGIYRDLGLRMEQGISIGDAMEQMEVFPAMMVHMFRAGEMNGRIAETAKRLADYYKKAHRLNEKVKTVMMYPKILGAMSFGMVLFIFLVVLPITEPVFAGMELPLLTRLLMGFSYGLRENWPLVLGASAVFILLWEKWKDHDRLIFLLDRGKLWAPGFNLPLQAVYTARFSRAMSSLYAGGLPMLTCMEMAGKVIGNRYIEKRFEESAKRVSAGEMLSEAVREVPGFDSRLSAVIFVGEETGKLDQMLEGIADSFEYEAETAVDRLVGLMEPAMILIMGIVIGLILVGIMIPLWSMYGSMA